MADISLLFDVATGSNPAGNSQQLIQTQLQEIVNHINANPLSIKFKADEQSLQSMRSQIQNIATEVSAGTAKAIKMPEVKISSKTNKATSEYTNATKAVKAYYDAVQKLHRSGLSQAVGFDDKTRVWSDNSGKYTKEVNYLNQVTQAYDNAKIASQQFNAVDKQNFDAVDAQLQYKLSATIASTANISGVLTSYTSSITKGEEALKKWSAAEHSRNEESRLAYKDLQNNVQLAQNAKEAYQNGSIGIKEYGDQIDKLKTSLKNTESTLKQNGDATKSLSERLSGLAKKFAQWFGVSQVIMWTYKNLKKMVDAVIELDTAMTELKKVTNETDATYERFLNNASTRAKKLGASLSDVVTASADFARLGFNIEEAEDLADAAIVYKNVGDGIKDVSDASESIIATMQAFGIEAKDVMTIVDKFNEVGNNYAISSKGVGDALLRSAAAMHSANNTLDETIALATASNTIVQDPDKVGTTLKTVSMYLRAAKTEAEDAGESIEGMAGSVSELREEILSLTGNKVDIQIDEDTFKSTYQILEELAGVWHSLTDVSQANILELIGGKRNANVVSAILENFSIAEKALETSASASGSALAENEKYLDSINGKISQFKATFEELSQNIFESESIKGVVELGTSLLNILNTITEIINKLGGLKTVLVSVASIIAIINAEAILGKVSASLSGLLAVGRTILGLGTNIKNVITAFKAFSNFMKITKDVGAAVNGFDALAAALKNVGIAASAAQLKMIAFMAIALAIVGIVKLVDHFTVSLEESREKLSELNQESQRIESELSSLNDELETTAQRIAELESKDAPTLTEKEELDNLKAQNAELQRQIDLLNLQKKINNKEKNKTFVETMDKNLNDSEEYHSEYGTYTDQSGETRHRVNRGSGGQYSYGSATEKDYINQQLSDYKNNLKEIAKIEKDYLSGKINEKTYEKKVQALKEYNEEIEQYLDDKNTEFQTDAEGIEYISNPTSEDDKKVNAWLDYINDFQDRMAIALGGENAKENAFNRLITTSFAETTNDLKDLGEQGKVTAAQLKDTKYEDFIDKLIEIGVISGETDDDLGIVALAFNSLGESAKNASDDISDATSAMSDFTKAMSGVQKLQVGFDQLDKIYTDIADGKDFDYASILNNKDFTDAFSDLGESYDNFMKTILDSPSDINACQTAFNELANAYINNSDALNDLTEDEKKATVAFLEQMGVANAETIVNRKLEVSKAKVRAETELSTGASWDSVEAMLAEETSSSVAKQALAELAIAKLDVNTHKIDTSADIDNIIAMANAANAGAEAIKRLQAVKAWQAFQEKGGQGPTGPHVQQTLDELASGTFNFDFDTQALNPDDFKPKYSGGSTYRDYVDKVAKEAEKNKPEKYDWITTSIARTEREIQNAKKIADSAYVSLDTKLDATNKQIKLITKEITLQEKALKKYKKEAESVKLSEDIKAKVRDGSIEINKYDSDTQALINDYKEWYEKALDCDDAIQDLNESLSSLYDKKFDDITSDYENQLSEIEHMTNTYENGLADLEARGYLGGQEYYYAMQDAERQRIALLERELSDLTEIMEAAIAEDKIEEGSDAWYEMKANINGVKEEIQAANTAIIKYQNSIDELDMDAFNFMQDRISAITNEAEFLIALLDGSDLFDDKGRITGEGLATAGLHAISYNTYMKQSEEYAKKILEINAKLANDPSNTKLIEQREELLELQRESILAAKSEKDAIIDMIEDGINKQLESMKELIDSYKDSLRSAKDLYEYQKKLKDQTSNIASLEKQLAAYENDDSEETRAKIQKIRVDLENARTELEETEYDKYISDTEKMLDNFYEDYEDTLNSRMDNVEVLISTMIDTINLGVSSISSVIQLASESLGYTLTSEMQSILGGSGGLAGLYGTNAFNSSATSTTVDSTLSSISDFIAAGSTIANSVISAFTQSNVSSNNATPATNNSNNVKSEDSPKTEKPKEEVKEKQISVGGKINAGSAKIYQNSSGKGATSQYFADDPIYVVLGEENGYIKVRHHKASSGVSGWFKKTDVKAYKTGGLIDYTGIAQVDGSPSKPELVLNAQDTSNFIQLKEALKQVANGKTNDMVSERLTKTILDAVNKLTELNQTQPSMDFGGINITIPIDHVSDYNDFMSQMQEDRQFENFIQDIIAGKLIKGSGLTKYKYKW